MAPQRSTQYAALASALAIPELRLSPLGQRLAAPRLAEIAGRPYVLAGVDGDLSSAEEAALWQMGATSEFFWLHEEVGGVPGPFLRPLTPSFAPALPSELVETRRYRGKTNELFSRVLINIARWAHTGEPDCLLDPLMGGGTFLFIALQLGLHAIGIEQQRGDVESTDTFLGAFLDEARVPYQRRAERPAAGRRAIFTIRPPTLAEPLLAALVHGDTAEAPALLAGLQRPLRPDLVAADLPYGIQHAGQIRTLLEGGLPAWHAVSRPGSVLGLAWDATRLDRAVMVAMVEAGGHWRALRGDAWEELAHPVDRAIKRRDVIVARRVDES